MRPFILREHHVRADGRLKDPDVVGAATHVFCIGLPQLRELPCWPKVTTVRLVDCPGLLKLPHWERATSVQLWGCAGLRELPRWPRVAEIECARCPMLCGMPCWEHVITIHIGDCRGLRQLPPWPRATSLSISLCPALRQLPLWPSLILIDFDLRSSLQPITGRGYFQWREAVVRTQACVAVLLCAHSRLGRKTAVRRLPPELLRMLSELL